MTSTNKATDDQKRDYYITQSYERVEGPLGGLAYFNADYGFLEAVIRGLRSGFLRDWEMRQLCQCTSLDDFKLTLADTDLCNVLNNVVTLTPEIIHAKCWEKYVHEFEFLRDQATGQLATFMDFMSNEHLIKNVTSLITKLIRSPTDAQGDILDKMNPLGMFPSLKSVLTFENSTDGLVELYRTVLVDTPVAPYFERYFNTELGAERAEEKHDRLEQALNEVEIDIITNMLQKLWLEDFYRYTQTLDGETAYVMKELLEFEADRRAIEITINSFGTQLNDPYSRGDKRKALYCNFGKLYPQATAGVAGSNQKVFTDVSDMQQLGEALAPYSLYRMLWQRAQTDGKSFQDALSEAEVYLNRLAFEGQSHFACFYAFDKLKHQELRNLRWITSCIDEGREQKEFNRWIRIF